MFENMFDIEFPEMERRFSGHSLRAHTMNGIAPVVVAAGIAAAGSIIAGMASKSGAPSGGGQSTADPKVLDQTNSSTSIQTQDAVYDMVARGAMADMAADMGRMAAKDRNYFEQTYRPFQESVAKHNIKMLPMIEKYAGDQLESMTKDLTGNNALQEAFRIQAGAIDSGDVQSSYESFKTEIANMPTEQERVGQALASVESQFSGAGKELARKYANMGKQVSRADQRGLSIEKAKAKAGLSDAAADAARSERVGMTERGMNAAAKTEQAKLGLKAGATDAMLAIQNSKGNALEAAKGTLVDVKKAIGEGDKGLDVASVAGGLQSTLGTTQLGTRLSEEQLDFRREGIKGAPKVDPETGILMIDDRKRETLESGEEIWQSEADKLAGMRAEQGFQGTPHSTVSAAGHEMYSVKKNMSNRGLYEEYNQREYQTEMDQKALEEGRAPEEAPSSFKNQEDYEAFLADQEASGRGEYKAITQSDNRLSQRRGMPRYRKNWGGGPGIGVGGGEAGAGVGGGTGDGVGGAPGSGEGSGGPAGGGNGGGGIGGIM